MKINQIIETQLDEIDRRGFLRGLGAAGAAAAVPGLAKAQSQTVPPLYLKAVNDIKAYLKPRLDKLPSPMIQYKKGIIVVKMTGTKVVDAEMKESTGVQKLDDYIIRVITAAGSFPQVQPLGRTGDHVMEFTTNNLLPAPGEESKKPAQQEPAQQPTQNTTPQNNTLSKFSIKGIRFGMTKDEITKVAKDSGISTSFGSLTGVNFGSLLGVKSEPDMNARDFGSELYYRGMPASLKFADDKLVGIIIINKSSTILELSNQLVSKFGSPDMSDDSKWQNRMGQTFDNKKMAWKNVDGASIMLKVRDDKVNQGTLIFAEVNAFNNEIKSNQDKKEKGLSDL